MAVDPTDLRIIVYAPALVGDATMGDLLPSSMEWNARFPACTWGGQRLKMKTLLHCLIAMNGP
jgi:hypothetical protein